MTVNTLHIYNTHKGFVRLLSPNGNRKVMVLSETISNEETVRLALKSLARSLFNYRLFPTFLDIVPEFFLNA